MKTRRYGLIFKGLSLGLCMVATLAANGQTLDTTIVGTKPIGKEIVVFVTNYMADVEVKTWNKGEVRIEYRFNLEARSQEEASAFYNKMKASISHQLNEAGTTLNVSFPFRNYIKNGNRAEVTFTDGGGKYALKELKTKLIIYMPEFNMLDAHCSFNKLTVGPLVANARIELSSAEFSMGTCRDLELIASFSKNMVVGDVDNARIESNSSTFRLGTVKTMLTLKSSFSSVEVGNIGNEANLELQSSSFVSGDVPVLRLKGSFIRNFIMNQVNTASIKVNSSELNFDKIGTLDIPEVSFSTLNIKRTGVVKINGSSSTTFTMDQLQSLEASHCSFSNFNIGSLKDRFITNANSGSIHIDKVMEGFNEIRITGSFVTTSIAVSPESSYQLTADLTFPQYTFDNVTIQNREKDMNHEVLKGVKGNDAQPKSRIQLTCQSCKISLK